MRGGLVAEVIRLGLRRVMSAPRLSLVLLTGSLLAVGLAASAPIFIEAVRDLGLRQLLRDADPAEMDLRFIQSGLAATEQSVGEVQNVLAGEAIEASGSLLVGQTTALRTGGYIVRPAAQTLEESDRLHGAFASQTDLEERAELTAGRLPQPDRADGVIEVALERQQAQVFGIAVGDEIIAQPFWLGTPAESRIIVVGTFEPPTDIRSWSTLDVGFLPISARDTELRLWTGRDDILGRLADQSPTLRVALLQRYRLDTSDLAAQSAEVAGDRLEIMETRLAQQLPGLAQGSALTSVLVGFRDRFKFAQGTLMMVVLQLRRRGPRLHRDRRRDARRATHRRHRLAAQPRRAAPRHRAPPPRRSRRPHPPRRLTRPVDRDGPRVAARPRAAVRRSPSAAACCPSACPPSPGTSRSGPARSRSSPRPSPPIARPARPSSRLAANAAAHPTPGASASSLMSRSSRSARCSSSSCSSPAGPVDTPLVGDTRLEWLAVITPHRADGRRRPRGAAPLPRPDADRRAARHRLALAHPPARRLVPGPHPHALRPHRPPARHRRRARRLRRILPRHPRILLRGPRPPRRRLPDPPARTSLRDHRARKTSPPRPAAPSPRSSASPPPSTATRSRAASRCSPSTPTSSPPCSMTAPTPGPIHPRCSARCPLSRSRPTALSSTNLLAGWSYGCGSSTSEQVPHGDRRTLPGCRRTLLGIRRRDHRGPLRGRGSAQPGRRAGHHPCRHHPR